MCRFLYAKCEESYTKVKNEKTTRKKSEQPNVDRFAANESNIEPKQNTCNKKWGEKAQTHLMCCSNYGFYFTYV